LAEEHGLPKHSRLTPDTKIGRTLQKVLAAHGLEEVEAAARYVALADDGRARWFRAQRYDLETLCRHVEGYAEAARDLGLDGPTPPAPPPMRHGREIVEDEIAKAARAVRIKASIAANQAMLAKHREGK
jgi:hypothetical protein